MKTLLMTLLVLTVACDRDASDHGHAHHDEDKWSVTAWGDSYEIFAECDPLVAGREARSHTHVTVLDDFSGLASGSVSATLISRYGRKLVYAQDTPAREGVFPIAILPPNSGEYDLVFRVEGPAGVEDIPAGTVTVASAAHSHDEPHEGDHAHDESEAHAHDPVRDHGHAHPEGDDGAHAAETVAFLKEQQWHTAFQTERAATGDIAASVRGPATVRAAAGAEALLTAPLDGIVTADTRVFAGREVKRGEELVRLLPRASSSVTLPELEAETEVARARLTRLEELLTLGAVSQAEVESARARLASLETSLAAAHGSAEGALAVRAPFDGRVAEVSLTPGGAVSAGDALVRVVRTPPVWIEVALAPRDAARLTDTPSRVALEVPGVAPVVLDGASIRLVSIAPQVDRSTGTVAVILEANRDLPFPLGTLLAADLVLGRTVSAGVVVPASAIVDDAGTPVIYVQREGESFERRAVRIVARQAGMVQVDGIAEGEHIVTVGGNDIRRAGLLSSGKVEGHVH